MKWLLGLALAAGPLQAQDQANHLFVSRDQHDAAYALAGLGVALAGKEIGIKKPYHLLMVPALTTAKLGLDCLRICGKGWQLSTAAKDYLYDNVVGIGLPLVFHTRRWYHALLWVGSVYFLRGIRFNSP